ncbi:MAG: DUF3187 family protein [Chthonomonadales bacterium]|nr:DUF3187 family protein [Chthonomonadales bacterium]
MTCRRPPVSRRFRAAARVAAALTAVCIASGGPAARAQADGGSSARLWLGGPLPTRSMRPYSLLFLQILPETPDVLPRGSRRVWVQLEAANTLLVRDSPGGAAVEEDTEVERLLVGWRAGLGGGTEGGVIVPLVWRVGGFMDEVIRWWHGLFGITATDDAPAGRSAYPPFRSVVAVHAPSGRPGPRYGAAAGLGDLTLSAKRPLLASSSRSAGSVRLALKLPTGAPSKLLGSGALDFGIGADARYHLGRDIVTYGGVGGVLVGRPTDLSLPARDMVQWYLACEYRANGRDSYLWQAEGCTAPVRTGNRFADGPQATASFAYRRRLGEGRVLSLWFAENGDIHNHTLPMLGAVGPDLAVGCSLAWSP